MMGPGESYPGHVHGQFSNSHHPIPMDLHVPQGFPYYRYRNDAFCWTERKPGVDEMTGQGSMNPRQPYDQTGRYQTAPQAMPILELRKEKSRDAARSRRGKENYEFYELAKMLPLPPAITSQLDKASIIRLTISYLKLKEFSSHGDPPWAPRDNTPSAKKGGNVRSRASLGNATLDLFEQHIGTHILQSLDGFAFSLAADGRFLYISETVSIYLGLSQVELTGSSVFDYIHTGDHGEIAEQLGLGLAHAPGANVPSPSGSDDNSSNSATNNPDVSSLMSITSNLGYKGLDRAFCVRMKSTLTKRGCHFKSSGYRVVLVLCRLRPQYSFSHTRKSPPPLLGMVAIAIALPPPSVHEIRLESDMFVTRLTFDFKVIHCEPRVSELLDYTGEELMGKNLYALCHAEDVNKLRKCHVDLLSKGQVMSQYYRLMNKNGGYTWIQSCATIISNSKNAEEQSIICVNYVISGKENSHVVLDCCQLEQDFPPTVKTEIVDDRERKSPDLDLSEGGGLSRGREGSGVGSVIRKTDPIRSSPPKLNVSLNETPPDLSRERRTNSQRGVVLNGSRNSEEAIDPQPLTPLTSLPPEHPDSRPPSKSLNSSPPPPSQKSTKGRKRKLDKLNTHVNSAPDPRPHSTINEDEGGSMRRNVECTNSNASSNNKRHLGGVNELNGGENSSSSVNLSSSSPISSLSHQGSSLETEGEGGRWRKGHQNHWDPHGGSSSVKDLEGVMSKHLGSRESDVGCSSGIDFSADSLLRGQSSSRGPSTLQWVPSSPQTSGGLPVSALLRQLCASRESVIRANVQASLAAARSGAPTTYYSDMGPVPSALPTPPGSESYSDPPPFLLPPHAKPPPEFTPYSYSDYQPPTITPPSSVSPRDKGGFGGLEGGGGGSGGYGESGGAFRPPGYLDGPAQPLPLKPQLYPYHPHDSSYVNSLSEQTQFYAGSHHPGFHLYHAGKGGTYGEALKTSNWYSTTS